MRGISDRGISVFERHEPAAGWDRFWTRATLITLVVLPVVLGVLTCYESARHERLEREELWEDFRQDMHEMQVQQDKRRTATAPAPTTATANCGYPAPELH